MNEPSFFTNMNDVSKDSGWHHNPAELKSAFGAAEPGNNGFDNGADSSGGSSPYPDGHGPNTGLHDGLTTNGSNGHHHHDASDDDQPPTPTMASGMTYGDLSPEHAGFYPEHSSVEPGFPNMVNLPGDLPEVTEEEEEERKQVEALVAGQGHSDQLVIDRVSPTSEDVHSAISAIETALLPEQTGLVADVEETGDEGLSDDDWNYMKPGDAPEAAESPMGGTGDDSQDELHEQDVHDEDPMVHELVQQQNLNPFLESVPAESRTPELEDDEDDDMARYRLNPDANVFVPQMIGHEILSPAPVVEDGTGVDLLQQDQQEVVENKNKGNPFEDQLIEPTGPSSPPFEPVAVKCSFDFASEAPEEVSQEVEHQAPSSSTPEFLQHLEQQAAQEPLIVHDIMQQHQEDMDSPFSDSGAAQPVEPETAQIGEASEDEAPAQTSFDEDHVEQNLVEDDSFEDIGVPAEKAADVPQEPVFMQEEEIHGQEVKPESRDVQDEIVEEHGVVEQADLSGEIEVGAEKFTEDRAEPAFEQDIAPAENEPVHREYVDPEPAFEQRQATPVEAEQVFGQPQTPVEFEPAFEQEQSSAPIQAEPAYEEPQVPVDSEPAFEQQLLAPVDAEPAFEEPQAPVDSEPAFEQQLLAPVEAEPALEEPRALVDAEVAFEQQPFSPVPAEPAFEQLQLAPVEAEPALENQVVLPSEPALGHQGFAAAEPESAFEHELVEPELAVQHQTPLEAPSPVELPQMLEKQIEGAHEERFDSSPVPEVRVEPQSVHDYEPQQFMDDYQPELAHEDEVEARPQEPEVGSSALLDFGGAGNVDLLGYPQMYPSMRHVASEAFASNMLMPEEHISRSDEVEDLTYAPRDMNIPAEDTQEQRSPAAVDSSVEQEFHSPREEERPTLQETVFYSPEEEHGNLKETAEGSKMEDVQTPPQISEPALVVETPIAAATAPQAEGASPVVQSVEESSAAPESTSEVAVAGAAGAAAAAGVAVAAAAGAVAAVAAKKKPAGAKPGSAPRLHTTKPAATKPAGPSSAKLVARAAPGAKPAAAAAGPAKPAPAKAPATRSMATSKSPTKPAAAHVAKKPTTTATTTTTAGAAKKPATTTTTAAPRPAAARPTSASTRPTAAAAAPRVPLSRPATATRPALGTSPTTGAKKPAAASPAARPTAARTVASPAAAAPKPRASPSTTSTGSPRVPLTSRPKPTPAATTKAPATTRPGAPKPAAPARAAAGATAKPKPAATTTAGATGTTKPPPIRRPGTAGNAQKPAAGPKKDAKSPESEPLG